MRVLTVWQPWASLLATGSKKNETRGWYTNIRGPIAIHSAKKPINSVIKLMDPDAIKLTNKMIHPLLMAQLPLGHVVAIGDLVECHLIDEAFIQKLSPEEILLGDYTLGRYAWEFKSMKLLPFSIPAKGGQGFWNWEPTTQGGAL